MHASKTNVLHLRSAAWVGPVFAMLGVFVRKAGIYRTSVIPANFPQIRPDSRQRRNNITDSGDIVPTLNMWIFQMDEPESTGRNFTPQLINCNVACPCYLLAGLELGGESQYRSKQIPPKVECSTFNVPPQLHLPLHYEDCQHDTAHNTWGKHS